MKQGTIARPKKSAGISISPSATTSQPEDTSGDYPIAEALPWLDHNKKTKKPDADQKEQTQHVNEQSGLAKLHALIKQNKSDRRAKRLVAEQAMQDEQAKQADQSLIFKDDELDALKSDHSYKEVVQQLTVFNLNPPAEQVHLSKEEAAQAELDALYEVLMCTSGSSYSFEDEIELFEDNNLITQDKSCHKSQMSGKSPQSAASKAITTRFNTKLSSAGEPVRANSTLNKLRKDEEDKVYTGCPESVERMRNTSQAILRFSAETSSTFELDDDEPKKEELALFYPIDEDDVKDTSPKLNRIK